MHLPLFLGKLFRVKFHSTKIMLKSIRLIVLSLLVGVSLPHVSLGYASPSKRKTTARKSPARKDTRRVLKSKKSKTSKPDIPSTTVIPPPNGKYPEYTPAPSSKRTSQSIATCATDSDCGEGWFCMEKVESCCEFNTTCRVPEGSSPIIPDSEAYRFHGTLLSTIVLSGIGFLFMQW